MQQEKIPKGLTQKGLLDEDNNNLLDKLDDKKSNPNLHTLYVFYHFL